MTSKSKAGEESPEPAMSGILFSHGPPSQSNVKRREGRPYDMQVALSLQPLQHACWYQCHRVSLQQQLRQHANCSTYNTALWPVSCPSCGRSLRTVGRQ
ncbi:hypothetical protein OKW38_000074 [Paraburkholderia sp. MM5496-R1]